MFLKHLITPKPSILFFFIFFSILFVLIPLIKFNFNTVFYHISLTPFIVFFLSLVTPFFLSIGLNNIIYEKNIIKKENLLIGSVFMLISCPFINTVAAWGGLFAVLFLLNYLIDSYQKDLPFSQFYNSSIIVGLVSFFFPNLIFLVLLLIINAINYSNFNWRIFITIILGLITPFLCFFIFSFVTDSVFLLPDFFTFTSIDLFVIEDLHLSKQLWLAVLLLVVACSFFELFIWLYKKSIKSRKTFLNLIWFFIITIIISIFSGVEYFYFSLLPLAIIIANYFVYTRQRMLANFLFILFLITSLHYRYMILF